MNEIKGKIVLEDQASSQIDKIINRVNKLGQSGEKVAINLQKMLNGTFSDKAFKIQEIQNKINTVIDKLQKQDQSGFEINELGAKRYAEQLYNLINELNQLQGAGNTSLGSIDNTTKSAKESTKSLRREVERLAEAFANAISGRELRPLTEQAAQLIPTASIKELETIIKGITGLDIALRTDKTIEELREITARLVGINQIYASLGHTDWDIPKYMIDQLGAVRTEAEKAANNVKEIGKAGETASKGVEKLTKKFNQLFKTYVVMRLFSALMSEFNKYIAEAHKALLDMDAATGGLIGYNQQLSVLNSALTRLSAQAVALGATLLNAFGPAIKAIIDGLNWLLEVLTMVIAALSGKSSYLVAKKDFFKDYAGGLKDTTENAEDAQKGLKTLYTLISGFDELNTLSAQNDSVEELKTAAGGLSKYKWEDLFEEKPLQGFMKVLSDIVKGIKDFLAKVPDWVKWLGLVAAAVAALIAKFKLKNKYLNLQNGLENIATKGLEWMWLVVGTGIALLPGLISKLKDLADKLKETGKATDDNLGEEPQAQWNGWGSVASGALAGVCAALGLLGAGLASNLNDQNEWSTNSNLTWENWKLGVLGIITGFITAGLLKFQEFKEKASDKINQFLTGAELNFNTGFANIKTIVGTALLYLLTLVNEWGTTLGDNFNNILTTVGTNVGLWLSNLTLNWTNGFNEMINTCNEFGKSIGEWAGDLGENIANGIINGVNGAIGALNGLVSAYKRAKQEDESNMLAAWKKHQKAVLTMGAAAVGAFVWKGIGALALPALKTIIPALAFANGGVITSPTMGLMGEYPNARNNPEIVAPQSILKDTIETSNAKYVAQLDKKLNTLIDAVYGVNMEVKIGDDVIAKSAARGNKAYKQRTGNNLLMI